MEKEFARPTGQEVRTNSGRPSRAEVHGCAPVSPNRVFPHEFPHSSYVQAVTEKGHVTLGPF